MRILFTTILLTLISTLFGQTSTDLKYFRASYNDDPATSITIGWTGIDATMYYGTTDFGTNYTQYPSNKTVTKTNSINYPGQTTAGSFVNKFIDLKNLSPKTTYYFVLKDANGKLSLRYSFRTMSNNPNDPISFISGGDTRDGLTGETCNCRGERQKSFTLLGKLCIDFITFSGDFVGGSYEKLLGIKENRTQWEEWFTDWQLTLDPSTNRLIPIIPTLGNHETNAADDLKLFNVPTTANYFSFTFGGNLLHLVSLNSELPNDNTQKTWFTNDLINNQNIIWKGVTYHKPMVPQGYYSPEPSLLANWAPLFSQYGVRLAMEGHTHIYKITFPAKYTGLSSSNYFVRNDSIGTAFIGEGNMGAPYRANLYSKFAFTREVGKNFTSFFHVRVSKDTMKITTVLVNANNASLSYPSCSGQGQELATNVDVYDAPDGATNPATELIPPFGHSDFNTVTTGVKYNTKQLDVAKLYPNPADDEITLQIKKRLKDAQIDMYDAMGKHIQSLYQIEDIDDISVDLSYVPSGTYYVYIKTNEGSQTLKFLKK